MKKKKFNEIIDRIKGTTDQRDLVRIAHAAMIRTSELRKSTGMITKFILESGCVSRIDYDLIFPGKEERTDD